MIIYYPFFFFFAHLKSNFINLKSYQTSSIIMTHNSFQLVIYLSMPVLLLSCISQFILLNLVLICLFSLSTHFLFELLVMMCLVIICLSNGVFLLASLVDRGRLLRCFKYIVNLLMFMSRITVNQDHMMLWINSMGLSDIHLLNLSLCLQHYEKLLVKIKLFNLVESKLPSLIFKFLMLNLHWVLKFTLYQKMFYFELHLDFHSVCFFQIYFTECLLVNE
jgi:hypothetical protein